MVQSLSQSEDFICDDQVTFDLCPTYLEQGAECLVQEVNDGVWRRQDAVLVQVLPPDAGPEF